MAQCTLDLSHPHFLASLSKHAGSAEAAKALEVMKAKVELEHTSCGRVVQQFWGNTKYTHLHGKIWKYDWSIPGTSSAGRKSWRLVVVVPDPDAQPLRLIAGSIYSKAVTVQLSPKELSEIFVCITKPDAEGVAIHASEETNFRRVSNGDEQTRSICMECFATIAVSIDVAVLDAAEATHSCPEQSGD